MSNIITKLINYLKRRHYNGVGKDGLPWCDGCKHINEDPDGPICGPCWCGEVENYEPVKGGE